MRQDTSAEAENSGSEEGSGKKYVIGLAMNTQTNPFFVDVKDGVRRLLTSTVLNCILPTPRTIPPSR